MKKPKVLVIVGPTASGKTSLSIELAREFEGEIVSADSRQVYKGLDIGSGKVTKEEMGNVPHHLLDVVEPSQVYTASDFTRDGRKTIEEITKNNRLPIVAGGTFFYVDTLLGRTSTPQVEPDKELRAKLETLPVEDLVKRLVELDSRRAATIDQQNPRRLIRAIEIATKLGSVPKAEQEDIYDVFVIGIDTDQEKLYENIHTRLIERLEEGMVAEVENLLIPPHEISHERLEDLGLEYRYVSRYLRGKLSYEEMVAELETKIRQFAKRQMTWLKHDQSIHWYKKDDLEAITQAVQTWLDK